MDTNTTNVQEAAGSDRGPHKSAPVHVLVVDDVEDNLLSTQVLLARPGLSVLIANCAARALELLEQHDVALTLMDVQMPNIDGFELAERMRRSDRTRNVPIIFLTGNAANSSRAFQGYEAGAVDFLIKPVDPRVLESKVRVFEKLYRQGRALRERIDELELRLQLNEAKAQELPTAQGEAI